MPAFRNRVGERHGRLTVVSLARMERQSHWTCRCDCGAETTVSVANLGSGKVRSCGCLKKDMLRREKTTHGMRSTPEYAVWCAMKQRCTNPNDAHFPDYGGRGIRVCERWAKFENFFEDMGPAPSRIHSLDRVDNNGNYEPTNCRWATLAEQARNKRNNHWLLAHGKNQLLTDWAAQTGLLVSTIIRRLEAGKTPEEALAPSRSKRAPFSVTSQQVSEIRQAYSHGDVTMSELGRRFGVSFQYVSKLVRGQRRSTTGALP